MSSSEECKHLKIRKTDVTGVFRVTLPFGPWGIAEARDERVRLIEKLNVRYPVSRASFPNGIVPDVLTCRDLTPGELGRFLDSDREGGWGVFFFTPEGEQKPSQLEKLPIAPAELKRTVDKMCASAGVVAWFDNTEWLVAGLDW